MRRLWARTALALLAAALLAAGRPARAASGPGALQEVARSEAKWTGVAVSRTGRVFVCFPRWSADVPVSVGELRPDGGIRAYPDADLNAWRPGGEAARQFVCAQSVHIDDRDRLWVLDPANPWLQGVVPGGAKLVRIDLATGAVARVYRFDESTAPAGSYLNDVRVDPRTDTAYLTESGLGALVVLDLATGRARRLLADHPATKAELDAITVEGRRLPVKIHADGLALDAAGGWLYFQALCGRTLYRAPTAALRDTALAAAALAERVQRHADGVVADGLLFAAEGIYVTALEENAIRLLDPQGRWRTVAADSRLRWPDSLALGPDGSLWVTTSSIHLGPRPPEPHGLYRLVRPSAGGASPGEGKVDGGAGRPRSAGRRTKADKVHGLRR